MRNLRTRLPNLRQGIYMRWLGSAITVFTLVLLANLAEAACTPTASKPSCLVVTISDTPDPVSSAGRLTYQVTTKNDGPAKSTDVAVTITLPPGVQFISCKTSLDKKPDFRCAGQVGQDVISTFPVLKAHKTVKVTVVVKAPTVSAESNIVLTAKAEGESAFKGTTSIQTAVVLPWADATMLPSGRAVRLHCGDILGSSFFQGSENAVQLEETMACTSAAPFGLKIDADNVTLNLQGKKILVDSAVINQAGIIVGPNATDVTVDGGGSAKSSNGIENFDWCLKDEGGNDRLIVKNLRCYKARSAALKLTSNNVLVSAVKIDSTTATTTTTQELGGVGIYAHGDNIRIKDSIIRRSQQIGVWADGVHAGDGYAVTIDGNTKTSRVEGNFGMGVVFEQGPHLLKDTLVNGDGPDGGTSTDGVVINSGVNHSLNGAVVKNFNGNGVVLNASTTFVTNASVESVGLNGVVISASATNVQLKGNKVKNNGNDGFAIVGNGNTLATNSAEKNGGDGFQITGTANQVNGNSAQKNNGIGYLVTDAVLGNGNVFTTNIAEKNGGAEWSIGKHNVNGGSNKANGNPISFGDGGGTFE